MTPELPSNGRLPDASLPSKSLPEGASQALRPDPSAAEWLPRHTAWLTMLARLEIDSRFQGKFSASDAAQQTLMTAFRDWGQCRATSEQQRLAWLKTILANQLAQLARRHSTAQRDVRREISLHQSLTDRLTGSSVSWRPPPPVPARRQPSARSKAGWPRCSSACRAITATFWCCETCKNSPSMRSPRASVGHRAPSACCGSARWRGYARNLTVSPDCAPARSRLRAKSGRDCGLKPEF